MRGLLIFAEEILTRIGSSIASLTQEVMSLGTFLRMSVGEIKTSVGTLLFRRWMEIGETLPN